MEKKNVQLTLNQARELYKDDKWRDVVLNSFSVEELTQPVLPISWYDLKELNGFFIGSLSTIKRNTTPNIIR